MKWKILLTICLVIGLAANIAFILEHIVIASIMLCSSFVGIGVGMIWSE